DRLALTPRLPANTLIHRPVWSIRRAIAAAEQHIENEIRCYDHTWAEEARLRLQDELARVHEYYRELISSLVDPEPRAAAEDEYAARVREIKWQYAPRIAASVLSTGLIHLGPDTPFLH